MLLTDVLIQGLLLGSVYALFALGLALMYGVMRLTNIAHGDCLVLAAFAAIAAMLASGWPALAAAVLVVGLFFPLGYVLQRALLNRVLSRDPLPALVVTFGLSIVIQNVLLAVFTSDPRSIDAGGLNLVALPLTQDLSIGALPLLVFAVSLLATAGLQAMMTRTAIGRAFRAVSDDPEAAQLTGLDARHVYGLATAIAFMLIAAAGVLQGMRTTVSPADGPSLLLFSFEAVIVGGMGSFWGAWLGAALLGVAQSVGMYFDPGWGTWFGHLIFLLTLLVRPQGLLPQTRD
ncbi:branched-chain amino acid ABC transporter permease [Cupriavidus oxalaticus]|uniref:Inner-membrane translocator n=1 Tax=Cupriavidus oxalaticus TaxID=96344 RepID=A0A375FM89_9BURK|nr:branched-chain amino acid ABC transporter permease [Cupriavidus oxalaticus]WQD84482.1 branched-chain amino acid ABC transporter permease [Cupriavidus oxalaticus]SPC06606.1 Inner-membrane translocator [Cupriavidus oxalaticus]SPC12414.1 Inner-membrane translocator [Cupriavidus oxalaticus]